jgi:S-(hydroxymethyl)glutathione dehydrogenase / alcohol dehydrogenase
MPVHPQTEPGDAVAIVGIGGVGMSALQGAVNAGARCVFAIDPVEWKRDQGLKFGATHVYPDIDAALMGIAEVTYGLMAKKVIVTVGELDGHDVDRYMNITSKGGTCVLTAIGSLLDTEVTLNLAMLTLMQKNLQGTIFGGGNPQYDIPQLLSMYKAGKLNLDDMITRWVPGPAPAGSSRATAPRPGCVRSVSACRCSGRRTR